ncbi:MAG TPA: hypothetical protein VMS38_28450, partial [Pseudorhodoferax sp.]|nr:hypothetical protein [Pseudorhodoferax sp.]
GLSSTLPPMARPRPVQPHTGPEHVGDELAADLLKAPVLQPYVDVLVLPGVEARRTEVELVDVQVVATGAGDDANALREAQAGLDEALIGGVVISLGAAFWATRGGALLASLLTMSPAWVHMDPLPVLRRRRRAERRPMPPPALAADGPEHNGARPPQAVAEDKT